MENYGDKRSESSDLALQVENRGGVTFVSFVAKDSNEARAYNQAVSSVLEKAGCSPTPHGPSAEGKGDQAGYQNWETDAIDQGKARALLPEIEKEAQRILEEEKQER